MSSILAKSPRKNGLGVVTYVTLKQHTQDVVESAASYLKAIESSPQRIQTREKLIGLYEELTQKDQAQVQRDKLVEIQKAMEEQRVKMEAAMEQQKQSMNPDKPSEVAAPPQEESPVAKEPE